MAMLKTLDSRRYYTYNNCYTISKNAFMHESDRDSDIHSDNISYSIEKNRRKLATIAKNDNGQAVCDVYKARINTKEEELFKVIREAENFIDLKDIKVIYGELFTKWEIADFRLNPSK